VNDFYQTDNPVIYACGDVIGYPALASTSMEQGRRAAQHMWAGSVSLDDDQDKTAAEHQVVKSVLHDGFLGRSSEQLFPYGIYTIPEISMVRFLCPWHPPSFLFFSHPLHPARLARQKRSSQRKRSRMK
jgi:NAD(P) transhydrogenase